MERTITLSKGGLAERKVDVGELRVPDLWHIANRLPAQEREAVLSCWYLAHALLNHVHDHASSKEASA